jgi:hypothetical protein
LSSIYLVISKSSPVLYFSIVERKSSAVNFYPEINPAISFCIPILLFLVIACTIKVFVSSIVLPTLAAYSFIAAIVVNSPLAIFCATSVTKVSGKPSYCAALFNI